MAQDEFVDRRVLVTGAGAGIGAAIAASFVRAGARVAAVDLAADRIDGVLTELPPGPGKAPCAWLIKRDGHETRCIDVTQVHSLDSRNRIRAPGFRATGPRGPIAGVCRSITPSSSRRSSRVDRSGFRAPSGRISATSRPRCEMTIRCPARTLRMISLNRALAS